jgi:predicted lipid-binding transport protein (Tim44 family)
MQNGFPYLDILIFGVIAIFLIFRLKNILGTKTGFEETNISKKQDNQFTNLVSLEAKKNDLENKELNKILAVDPKFNISDFLNGSKNFFEMVLNSFVSGNLNNIKDFTKPSVLKSFKAAIDDRNKENETLIIDLKSIKENKIIKSTVTKSSIKINVKYVSLQIRVLMDKHEQIIDGDDKKEIIVKDEWVFERKIEDQNPNWTLIETKSY